LHYVEAQPSKRSSSEDAMDTTIGFLGIGGAIFASFAVALSLEWLSLVMLIKMMPASAPVQTTAQKFAAIVSRPSPNPSPSHADRKAA
jgi:hypothetical protein